MTLFISCDLCGGFLTSDRGRWPCRHICLHVTSLPAVNRHAQILSVVCKLLPQLGAVLGYSGVTPVKSVGSRNIDCICTVITHNKLWSVDQDRAILGCRLGYQLYKGYWCAILRPVLPKIYPHLFVRCRRVLLLRSWVNSVVRRILLLPLQQGVRPPAPGPQRWWIDRLNSHPPFNGQHFQTTTGTTNYHNNTNEDIHHAIKPSHAIS